MKKLVARTVALGSLTALVAACSSNAETKAKEKDSVITTAVAHDPVVQATSNAKNAGIIKTVDDAYMAMREIRAARLAIFDGSGPAATTFVNEASTKLKTALELAGNIKVSKAGEIVEGGYVPFDVSMAIGEDYTASPKKTAQIAEANGHLKEGNQQKAVEVLRLADINVLTTAALLPVDATMEHITDAANLLKQGKYYDANIALKAIEDSVVVQAYDVNGVPVKTPAIAKAPAKSPAAKSVAAAAANPTTKTPDNRMTGTSAKASTKKVMH